MKLYDCYDHEYESSTKQCPCCIKERSKKLAEQNRFEDITIAISELGPKLDSGRHTGADVERMNNLLKEYKELEIVLRKSSLD